MAARSVVVVAVVKDSAYWSLCAAAVTGVAVVFLRTWAYRWFFSLNICACTLWFVVMLHRLFIPRPSSTPAFSVAEMALPVAQLGVRLLAGVYATTPYGPHSSTERMVWCVILWGISVMVHALTRLWYVVNLCVVAVR